MASPLITKEITESEVKEGDWELVLETNPQKFESRKTGPEADVRESTNDALLVDSEDWYKTIPATPANTPEFTPSPPSYPSFGSRKADLIKSGGDMDLPPIREDVAEAVPSDNSNEESENSSEEYDPEISSDVLAYAKTVEVAGNGLLRMVLYGTLFYILKLTFTRMVLKYKEYRDSRQQK